VIKKLEKEVASKEFWINNQEDATEKQKKLSSLQEESRIINSLKNRLKETEEMYQNFKEDDKIKEEVEEELEKIKQDLKKEEFKVFLSGKFDKNDAIIEIQSGAGGRDAEDFVTMLFRMYQRYSERKNFKTKVIYTSYGESGGPEGRVGIKKIVFEVKGVYAFGILKKESGAHRLVRKSPFSSGGARHTSFAQVEVFPVIKRSSNEVVIKEDDLKVDTFKSSGPGGQNVNKRESAIRITHVPTGLVVSSQNERKQSENRRIAMSVLQSKLEKMKEDREKREEEKAKGETSGAGWGNQIRNYVLHPYQLVKDLRTKNETTSVEEVFDGNLDLLNN
jgi:peptide chain release factor 2